MRIIVPYLFFIVCLITAPQKVPSQMGKSAYNFSRIDRKINGWVDSGYYTGASIIIVKDNNTIHQKYFGNYKPETVAYIASAGKWLAAATIAAVVDDGKLSWDDKVKKWLPEFNDTKGEATLRQLMSHTAGYPDYQPKGALTDNYQTLKESVRHIVVLTADTLPGKKFKYGGLAMQVAGRMAELATGKDWETIFQEKIARPLEMYNTHFTPVDTKQGGHAPMLGGGARTDLQSYANFLSMIYNNGIYRGKRILSAKAIKEMQADQVGHAKVNRGEFVENARGSLRKDIYGLGEWREDVNMKGEATLISSPSWAGAYPWIDKKNNVYGFFLTRIASMKVGFSSFLASPVLPLIVRDAIREAEETDLKKGYLDIGDAKLYYEELGKGEPLILLHGHSLDHNMWQPQFREFAKTHRVINYDLRGYGKSSMPVEGKEFLHAEDLLKLMNELHIEKAHLVGLSLGGTIAADFVALHQDRILSATLASGDVFDFLVGPSTPWTEATLAKRKLEIEAYKKKGIDANKREWFNKLSVRNGKVIEHIRRPLWEMIYKWDAWQPLHAEPRLVLGSDLVTRLKEVNVIIPIMVLTGDADAGIKNKFIESVPSAKQVFVTGAGHMSNMENPEGFNKAVLKFLKTVKKR
jgi:CubicO group peptidase (beta-lactamase class C family)/pimeloyl-ACP methyl ester carboxylesterase